MTKQILSPHFFQNAMQFEEIVKLMNVCILHEKRNLCELVQKNKGLKVFRIQEQIDIKKKDYFTLIVNRKLAQGMIEVCQVLGEECVKNEGINWKKIGKYLSDKGKSIPTVATRGNA